MLWYLIMVTYTVSNLIMGAVFMNEGWSKEVLYMTVFGFRIRKRWWRAIIAGLYGSAWLPIGCYNACRQEKHRVLMRFTSARARSHERGRTMERNCHYYNRSK